MSYNKNCQSSKYIALVFLLMCSHAQAENKTKLTYKPTSDFSVFWPQLRNAFLTADPIAVAALTPSKKFPLRNSELDMSKSCERKAAKAFLTYLHKTFTGRPPRNWKGYLENNPKLDLIRGDGLYQNALGEYSAHLKVRFVNKGRNKYWKISEVLFTEEEFYEFSKRANGPSKCN